LASIFLSLFYHSRSVVVIVIAIAIANAIENENAIETTETVIIANAIVNETIVMPEMEGTNLFDLVINASFNQSLPVDSTVDRLLVSWVRVVTLSQEC